MLWRRDPTRVLPIASLTKMMTALIVARRVPKGSKVRITREALSYKGSGVGMFRRGRRIGVETMLYGLLLPSGNDAAIALAQKAGGGTVGGFVALMNRRARAMGLACTRFSSPDGFVNRGNHSCAPDLAALARAVLREPRLARIVRRRQAVLPFPIKGGKLYLYNHNPLLQQGYRGVTGIKTGYTASGRPLPRGDRAPRPGAPRRRAAALAGPRRAGAQAAGPRLPSGALGGERASLTGRLPPPAARGARRAAADRGRAGGARDGRWRRRAGARQGRRARRPRSRWSCRGADGACCRTAASSRSTARPRTTSSASWGSARRPAPPGDWSGRRSRTRGRARPVLPAMELITVTAAAHPGEGERYNTRQDPSVIRRYLRAARRAKALLVLDIQPGRSDFFTEATRLKRWLSEPDVGLALDPEWRMGPGEVPGQVIGSVEAREVNAVSAWLSQLVVQNDLPQKLFLIHQFTNDMVDDTQLQERPGLAMVLNADGFGTQELKTRQVPRVHVARRARSSARGSSSSTVRTPTS